MFDPEYFEKEIVPKEFVDRITHKYMQSKTARPDATAAESFDSTVLLQQFERVIGNLGGIAKTLDGEILSLSQDQSEAEVTFKDQMSSLQDEYQTTFEKVQALDKRIYGVSNTAVRIGDRLEAVDQQRKRAEEAKQLVERFAELNDDEREPSSSIWTADDEIHQRAELVKRLSSLAQDLELPQTRTGKRRVEERSNQLENDLLQQFDTAMEAQHYARMGEIASSLYTFNGGDSCVRLYIGKLQMFFDVEILRKDESLASELTDTTSGGFGSEERRRLGEFFEEIADTCAREHKVIAQVFPNPPRVMRLLVSRVFEQRIRNFLDKALAVDSDKLQDLERHMKLMAAASILTKDLVKSLSIYDVGFLKFDDLIHSVFTEHKEGYLDKELKCLSLVFADLERHIKATSTEPPLPFKDPTVDTVAWMVDALGELPLTFLRSVAVDAVAHAEAICETSEIPRCGARIFNRTLSLMGPRFLMLALDVTLRQLKLCRKWFEGNNQQSYQLKQAKKVMASAVKNISSAKSGFSSMMGSPSQVLRGGGGGGGGGGSAGVDGGGGAQESESVQRTHLHELVLQRFFRESQQVNQTVVLLQDYFHKSVLPLARVSINDHTQCLMEKTSFMSQLEGRLSEGIDTSLTVIAYHAQHILAKEQQKNDFQIKDIEQFDTSTATRACMKALEFVRRQVCGLVSCLDGSNLQQVLVELGSRFQRVIITHVRLVKVSSGFGGMKLMRDLTEYRDYAGELHRSFSVPELVRTFDTLRELANLHVVNPENIMGLIHDTGLSTLPSEDLVGVIQQRSDYKEDWMRRYVHL